MGKRRNRKSNDSSQADSNWNPVTVKRAMVKALILGGAAESEIEASKIITDRKDEWGNLGAVDPVLDLDSLLFLHEISDTLRQCVDAYVCNIEGNGFILKPKIDLEKEDAEQVVSEIMEAEQWADLIEAASDDEESDDVVDVDQPSESEIKERSDALKRQIRREMHIANAWLQNCSPKKSFDWLRSKKRVDEEVIGHAAWEVLRDNKGRIRRLEHIPAHTILPMTDSGKRVNVTREEWISRVSTARVTESVSFRQYVQRESGKTRYFKEFGDPRAVDADTGKVYEAKYKKDPTTGEYVETKTALEVMQSQTKDAVEATEVIYFAVESPHTPAGMIRWAGWIVGVFGNRAAAESNLAYFENHAIPEAALLIGGGQLNDRSIEEVRSQLNRKHKGAKNHHRLLVLQALGKSTRPNEVVETPEMKWVNLSDFQKGDSLFGNYSKANQDGITSSFRQSPILTGRIPSDLNRATAWAVLFQADRQVYGPLRREFDRFMNTILLPAIGCYSIEFESLSPVGTDIETMSKALDIGIKGGAFTPNEVRKLFSLWLNEPFEAIKEDWANIPFQMVLNQIGPDGNGVVSPEDQAEAVKEYDRVMSTLERRTDILESVTGAKDGFVDGVEGSSLASNG